MIDIINFSSILNETKNTRSKTSDAERCIDDGLLADPSVHHLIQLNETSKQKFLVSSV
jgi:hypothetical protein